MIKGVGTDIIDVYRVEKKISTELDFKVGIFTSQEIEYCESKKTIFQTFAGRYAAKEAFFKSLGTGWRYGMKYLDIEIINDSLGKPEISLNGKAKAFCDEQGINDIHLSISHIKEFATAVVITEKIDYIEE